MGYGDHLMDAGAARIAQETDPRRVRIIHGKKIPWSEIWLNNPRIAMPDEKGDFQIVYGRDVATNMRGYHTFKTPLQWGYEPSYRPPVGEIYLTKSEIEFGARYKNRLIIEPNIKATGSPNKQWGWQRWQKLALLLRGAGIKPAQLGNSTCKKLDGVEFIPTVNFRAACAIMANARACVLPEGGLHHAAAALGIKGVVIFGGFTPIELTGYPMHTNVGASFGDACGMRIPCEHCADWMASITPQQVFDNLMEVLNA